LTRSETIESRNDILNQNTDIELSGYSRTGTPMQASYKYSNKDGFIKYTYEGASPLIYKIIPEELGLTINDFVGDRNDYDSEEGYKEAVEGFTKGAKVK
jgi:hypothetical protein